jgi:hypothetical protein
MPGSSDLRQANNDRARATSAAVKPPVQVKADNTSGDKRDETKNNNSSDNPLSNHRSILGANFSILQTLNSIKFSPGTEGMYNDTAYIRLWKRGSTKDTQAGANIGGGVETPTYDKLDPFGLSTDAGVGDDVENLYSLLGSGNATQGGINTQKSLEGTVPSTKTQSVPNPTVGVPGTKPSSPPVTSPSGIVKNANPGKGGINGVFRTVLNYSGNLTLSSWGKTGTIGVIPDATACAVPGIWQFLFNPEEIDWEGGPEYDEAQTWGVMGQSNSGKPLFWKSMKNERLTFSKILLNGYVFGKRVDSLERGLKDLFYREDGDNPTGPPILEFVWKDRQFGPCVIQDVRIKEKNWDSGVLVNAEVSFSLVKVPEWIVNDGYVDVARPSAQPVVGDVFASPSNPAENRDVKTPPSPPPATKPAPEAKLAPKLETSAAKGDLAKCGYAKTSIANFQDLVKRVGEINVFWFGPNFDVLFDQYKRTFKNVEGVFSSDFTKYVTTRYTPTEIDKTYKLHPRYTEKFGPMLDELKFACLNSIAALKKVQINLGCPSDKPK